MNPDPTHHPFSIRSLAGALALVAALALVGGLHPALAHRQSYQPAYVLNDHVQEEVNTSAFAMILGEVRASMADLMWVKTERYLHRGVAYKPHLDADTLAHTGEVTVQKNHEDHEGHDDHHPDLVALVPDAASDYRGFIGALQRAVQPWRSTDAPDEHTAGNELIPWYRMLTLSNPRHWRGYMIGSWWLTQLKDEPAALAEAAGFIEEGIRNNPEVFQLQLMEGRVRIQQRRWADAVVSFERAVALAFKIRPEGGAAKPPLWTDSDEEDFAAALRYIPSIQWRKLNDVAAARASTARGLTFRPRDVPLRALRTQLAPAQP